MSEPSFLANVLKPGASLNTTFFLVVDGVLAALLVVLLSLAYLTLGNPHIFALIGIEMALWASIKWFIYELRNQNPLILMEVPGDDEDSKKKS